MAKLLYFISEDWFFCSHFMERAKLAQEQGFEIVVLARETRHGQCIRDAGFRLVALDMERSSTHLWSEWLVLRQVWRAYRQEKPDLLHHIALKPIIYGSLVALLQGLRGLCIYVERREGSIAKAVGGFFPSKFSESTWQ
jgi:hypothetical protein